MKDTELEKLLSTVEALKVVPVVLEHGRPVAYPKIGGRTERVEILKTLRQIEGEIPRREEYLMQKKVNRLHDYKLARPKNQDKGFVASLKEDIRIEWSKLSKLQEHRGFLLRTLKEFGENKVNVVLTIVSKATPEYKQETVNNLHTFVGGRKDCRTLLAEILRVEPDFPRDRTFEQTWGITEDNLQKIRDDSEREIRQILEDVYPGRPNIDTDYPRELSSSRTTNKIVEHLQWLREQLVTHKYGASTTGSPPIDQDSLIDKFEAECVDKNLEKGKTIPNDVLYDIARTIGIKNIGTRQSFKAGNRAYQQAREYASRLRYKRKQTRNT